MSKIIKKGINSLNLKLRNGLQPKDNINNYKNSHRIRGQPNMKSNIQQELNNNFNGQNQHNDSHKHQQSVGGHANRKVKYIYQFSQENSLLQAKMKPSDLMVTNSLLQKVEQLKYTAAYNKVVSLSANQIDISSRIFVILKKHLIIPSKWKGYQVLDPIKSYDTIINPQLLSYSEYKYKADEECATFQGLKFKIWVAIMNQFKCFRLPQIYQNGLMKIPQNQKSNAKNQKNQIQKDNLLIQQKLKLTGFYGRVFDHQYRHLEGLLVNNIEISAGECYLNDQFKTNPQNYDNLNEIRQQQKYFLSGKFQKQLTKSMYQNQSKMSSKSSKGIGSAQKIPQKITPQMKENLMKSYKQSKQNSKSNKKRQNSQKTQSKQKQPQNQKNQGQKKIKVHKKKKMLQRQLLKIVDKYHQDKENEIQEKIKGLTSSNKQEDLIIKNKPLATHRSGKKTLNLSSQEKINLIQKQNLTKK